MAKSIGGKVVVISVNEYNKLLEDSRLLSALQGAGVDNWQGYDQALTILEEMEAEDVVNPELEPEGE